MKQFDRPAVDPVPDDPPVDEPSQRERVVYIPASQVHAFTRQRRASIVGAVGVGGVRQDQAATPPS